MITTLVIVGIIAFLIWWVLGLLGEQWGKPEVTKWGRIILLILVVLFLLNLSGLFGKFM